MLLVTSSCGRFKGCDCRQGEGSCCCASELRLRNEVGMPVRYTHLIPVTGLMWDRGTRRTDRHGARSQWLLQRRAGEPRGQLSVGGDTLSHAISGPVERDGACVGLLMASFPQEEEGRPDLIWVRLRRSDMVAGVEAQG